MPRSKPVVTRVRSAPRDAKGQGPSDPSCFRSPGALRKAHKCRHTRANFARPRPQVPVLHTEPLCAGKFYTSGSLHICLEEPQAKFLKDSGSDSLQGGRASSNMLCTISRLEGCSCATLHIDVQSVLNANLTSFPPFELNAPPHTVTSLASDPPAHPGKGNLPPRETTLFFFSPMGACFPLPPLKREILAFLIPLLLPPTF